jgi:two-component system, cell cycle sensor histidine kinase and response regulator CckA
MAHPPISDTGVGWSLETAVLNAIGEAVVATGPDGTIAYWNDAAHRLFGWRADEVLGRIILDVIIPPSERAAARANIALILGGEQWSGEFLCWKADGTTLPIHVTGSPLLDEHGRVVGLVGVAREIPHQRQALAVLRLQSAALNAAANAIVITDRQGVIEWTNHAFSELTGYTRAEAIGRNPRDLVRSGAHAPEFYAELWHTILAGNVWHGEMTNRRKDGTIYPEEMTVTPVRDASGEIAHFVAIKQDLTRVKQLQAQYLQAQKMEIVGRLAGGIAHDFNNILSVINGTAELAAARLAGDDPLLDELLQIQQAGERAAGLTAQLLAFGRQRVVAPRPLRLDLLVAEWEDMLSRVVGEHIDLVVRAPRPVGYVRADQAQVGQILMNLVVNARDAMPDGGTLTIQVHDVELDAAYAALHLGVSPGSYVMLAVHDTGVGMDAVTRARIFEPFFSTKDARRGSGLGLATVYGIVAQSGGTIWVYSEPGRGSAFKIYLPRIVGAHASDLARMRDPIAGGTETVLLVEDDEALAAVADRILSTAGYLVLTAGNAMDALRLLAEHPGPIHLLFTDLVLPAMPGTELAVRVAALSPDTRVLFTSGYTEEEAFRAGVQAGPFLSKPYTAPDLIRMVRTAIDESPPLSTVTDRSS